MEKIGFLVFSYEMDFTKSLKDQKGCVSYRGWPMSLLKEKMWLKELENKWDWIIMNREVRLERNKQEWGWGMVTGQGHS